MSEFMPPQDAPHAKIYCQQVKQFMNVCTKRLMLSMEFKVFEVKHLKGLYPMIPD